VSKRRRKTPPVGPLGRVGNARSGVHQTLAYIDIFWVLTIAASIMFLLSFLVRKNDPKAGGGVAVG
jgi:hypothetical protein